MTLNEWAAEQCGIETIIDTDRDVLWRKDLGKLPMPHFKLADARCREIVREHFKLVTEYYEQANPYWECWPIDKHLSVSGIGKTIAEAEINCIEAIRREHDKTHCQK